MTVVSFAAYGLYCVQNYRHCHEVHCRITGPGFLLAAGLMLVRALGPVAYGLGVPYLVFVPAGVAHYFHSIAEELSVLVV